jgi:hypothetical protein
LNFLLHLLMRLPGCKHQRERWRVRIGLSSRLRSILTARCELRRSLCHRGCGRRGWRKGRFGYRRLRKACLGTGNVETVEVRGGYTALGPSDLVKKDAFSFGALDRITPSRWTTSKRARISEIAQAESRSICRIDAFWGTGTSAFTHGAAAMQLFL